MKTLDEAVELIGEDLEMMTANLMSTKDDLENPVILRLMTRQGEHILSIIMKAAQSEVSYVEILAKVCAQLHVMYGLGKTVGIMMERQEL